MKLVLLFAFAAAFQVATAEYIWHDVEVTGRAISTNCSATQMWVVIDDPRYGIFNDTATLGGDVYVAWTDASNVRQSYHLAFDGAVTNGYSCSGTPLEFISNGDSETGIIVATFLDTDDLAKCGAVLTTTDLDGDSTADVFYWSGPIITVRYNKDISTIYDVHVQPYCEFYEKAQVQSVDIGSLGREPDLVTDFGSLFANLTMTVYRVMSTAEGEYSQFIEVMNRELVPVGTRLVAVIDLYRNEPEDDVGIKHFKCYAVNPYATQQDQYGLIDGGCPDSGSSNLEIGDDVNVQMEFSAGVTRLMFFYDQFALGDLYRLYCIVELCTPSIADDCTNTCSKKRRKRRQAGGAPEKFVSLNKTINVFMDDPSPTSRPFTPTDGPEGVNIQGDVNASNCSTRPEFLVPLCVLGALLLILIIVCACILRRLNNKDKILEKYETTITSAPSYPASSYRA